MRNKKEGFTVIELMIVVVIVMIMFAFAIKTFKPSHESTPKTNTYMPSRFID